MRTCWASANTERPFTSVVARGSIFGAQFHPEKSSVHGLRMLANFAALAARTPA